MGFETALKLASVREQLAFRIVPQEIKHQSSSVIYNGYPNSTAATKCPTKELQVIPGPRANVRELDFTPILRTTFDIVAIK